MRKTPNQNVLSSLVWETMLASAPLVPGRELLEKSLARSEGPQTTRLPGLKVQPVQRHMPRAEVVQALVHFASSRRVQYIYALADRADTDAADEARVDLRWHSSCQLWSGIAGAGLA